MIYRSPLELQRKPQSLQSDVQLHICWRQLVLEINLMNSEFGWHSAWKLNKQRHEWAINQLCCLREMLYLFMSNLLSGRDLVPLKLSVEEIETLWVRAGDQLHQVCWAVWTPCPSYWSPYSSQKLMLLLLPAGIVDGDGPSPSAGPEEVKLVWTSCYSDRTVEGKALYFRGKSFHFAYMMLAVGFS